MFRVCVGPRPMDGFTPEDDDVELASPTAVSDGHVGGVVSGDHQTPASPKSPVPLHTSTSASRYPQHVTPDTVLGFTEPTQTFLCPLSANKHGFDFHDFEIKDYSTNESIFKVSKPANADADSDLPDDEDMDATFAENPHLETAVRTVKYTFPKRVLRCAQIRTALTFSIGDRPASDFRLIERHYFKDTLLKSYDFTFGFVIPNSTNGWDAIYGVDREVMTPAIERLMVAEPFSTTSDSFYFVGNDLVMHNKAAYAYT